MTWRHEAEPVIAEIIRNLKRKDNTILRKAFLDAYPFTNDFPYKDFFAEIKRRISD